MLYIIESLAPPIKYAAHSYVQRDLTTALTANMTVDNYKAVLSVFLIKRDIY